MKTAYHKIINSIESLKLRLHVLKMRLGNHYVLRQNRKLYHHITWSKNQKQEFDAYWKQHYGKKISSKGHKYYESMNGCHHKDYFPEILYATKLEPKLNKFKYAEVYSDKNLFSIVYARSKELYIPKTYIFNAGGKYYDSNRKPMAYASVLETLKNIGEVVIKPSIGGSEGKGVVFCNLIDGIETIENRPMTDVLKSYNIDFLIQEAVNQHPSFARLHPASLNTIRVITYIAEDDVHCTPLCMRMGTGSAKVDNLGAGGIIIGLSAEGELNKYAYKLGASTDKFDKHPDTQIVFKDYEVAGIPQIVKVAKELHGYTPHIGIISWDLVFSDTEEVTLIEANFIGQSLRYPQMTHALPAFGEHTPYMLNLIRS